MINLICNKIYKNIIQDKIGGVVRKLKDSNEGASIVEVILILVILIGIVLIFKTQITAIINDAFKSITNDSNSIIK